MRSLIFSFILFLSLPLFAESFLLHRVVDGDTIVVLNGNTKITVRLIGIDTPESRRNKKTLRDSKRSGKDINTIISQGKQATAFVKSLLHKGDKVTLKYDVVRNDRYGRTLAYVYLSDNKFLNELIVSNGYAVPMTIPPNVQYKDLFLTAYKQARINKKGLWKN